MARGVKNDGFLVAYRRSLIQSLSPLLKNHLVPRVQAMIVLGQAAAPTQEGIKLFQDEIANPSQALWVKLWALEKESANHQEGRRADSRPTSRARPAGRSACLPREGSEGTTLPWPIQMRGLEALGWLRQSGLPAEATRAYMANMAMAFLADTDAKFEVRARGGSARSGRA